MDRVFRLTAQWSALLGGTALLAMIIVVCVSIVGRSLIPVGLSPIKGDYEIVEALAAFAVFAFLPWCQFTRSHASVDIVTAMLPAPVNRVIDIVAEVLMTVFLYLVTWRLFIGATDKFGRGDSSFILGYPIWWIYAAGLVGAVIACLISTYLVWVRFRRFDLEDAATSDAEMTE